MRKIYQKNISGAKNAFKRKFDALTAACSVMEKRLGFLTKTFGNDGRETRGNNRMYGFVLPEGYCRRSHRVGFTLIELLVVVLIIGILAAAALPQYQRAVYKSKVAKLLLLSNAYNEAAKVYYLANGKWPSEFDELDVTLPSGVDKLTPTANDCGLFDDMYCCLGTTVSGYQESHITCGLNNYVLGIIRVFPTAYTYNMACVAKNTDSNAISVCKTMFSNQHSLNLVTPIGHQTGYTYYADK